MNEFEKIEKKWQKEWAKAKVFEANPDKRKKFFLTFPYPYINAYGHIGHFYTLMKVEAFARYKRLQGCNVLFPQGWHATGSPIISSAKRVREREPKQMKIMKDMNIPDSEIPKFEDAKYWISFFFKSAKRCFRLVSERAVAGSRRMIRSTGLSSEIPFRMPRRTSPSVTVPSK